MDLIDRQAALDALSRGFGCGHVCRNAIKRIPAIDAIEVVRCKDCKHLFDGEHNANCCEVLMEKAKWLIEITVDENWYCADGERRTDERAD